MTIARLHTSRHKWRRPAAAREPLKDRVSAEQTSKRLHARFRLPRARRRQTPILAAVRRREFLALLQVEISAANEKTMARVGTLIIAMLGVFDWRRAKDAFFDWYFSYYQEEKLDLKRRPELRGLVTDWLPAAQLVKVVKVRSDQQMQLAIQRKIACCFFCSLATSSSSKARRAACRFFM